MVRAIGGLLVVVGCCLCGLRAARYLSARVRLLEELIQAVGILEQELALFRPALPELLTRMGRGCNSQARELLASCRIEVEKGKGFTGVWEIEVDKLPLTQQEKRLLYGLGQVLGQYDARGQVQVAEYIRVELERCVDKARQDSRVRGKLYQTLGATAGGFLLLTLM